MERAGMMRFFRFDPNTDKSFTACLICIPPPLPSSYSRTSHPKFRIPSSILQVPYRAASAKGREAADGDSSYGAERSLEIHAERIRRHAINRDEKTHFAEAAEIR